MARFLCIYTGKPLGDRSTKAVRKKLHGLTAYLSVVIMNSSFNVSQGYQRLALHAMTEELKSSSIQMEGTTSWAQLLLLMRKL